MAPPIEFIEAALSYTGGSQTDLSYTDPNQKWIIRENLVSLLQEFQSLTLSIEPFIHNDGTTVNLLNVNGFLPASSAISHVPIIIWIHENYPYEAPLAFFLLTPATPIRRDHPYVNSSGAITTPYLNTWCYPRSNLLDLTRNLVRLFSNRHSFIDPTIASKMEALDLLVATLHSDMVSLQIKTEEDITGLSGLQAELNDRSDILTAIILSIDHERSSLKRRVSEMTEDADVLMNWLRVNDRKSFISSVIDDMNAIFMVADEKSDLILNNLAADEAIEDVLYALDKAMEEGVVPLGEYLRKVRFLSREQFFHRAMWVQLRSSNIHTKNNSSEPYF